MSFHCSVWTVFSLNWVNNNTQYFFVKAISKFVEQSADHVTISGVLWEKHNLEERDRNNVSHVSAADAFAILFSNIMLHNV